jgi:hypothetical protein
MAKQRPVPPGGRKPANPPDDQGTPARPPTVPTPPGPRRPPAGDPSDPRPIAAPFMQHPAPGAPVDHPDHAPAAGYVEPGQPASGTGHPAPDQRESIPQEAPEAAGTAESQPTTSSSTRFVRTSGRPMPSPRRTPPPENSPIAAAHPSPQVAQQHTPGAPADQHWPEMNDAPADPHGPQTDGTPTDPHGPETDDSPTDPRGTEITRASADPRRPEPQNSSPAAGRSHPLPAAGNQRSFAPPTGRRPETVGVAKVRPLLPGLQLQPMVHVDDMPAAVAFYEKLGGEINHGDRDGEWVLMQVGTAQIGLVTRPPDASRGESTVELNFAATMPLDRLEQLLRDHDLQVVEVARDLDLGTQLHIETPDGMPIKIHQVEPDLLV